MDVEDRSIGLRTCNHQWIRQDVFGRSISRRVTLIEGSASGRVSVEDAVQLRAEAR